MTHWILLLLAGLPQDTAGTVQAYAAVLTEIHAAHPGNTWSFSTRPVGIACEWHCTDPQQVGTHPPELIARLKATGLIENHCTPARNQTGCRVRMEQKSVGLSPLELLPGGDAKVYAVLGLSKPEDEHPDVRTMEYTLRRDCNGRWIVTSKELTSIT